MTPLAAAQHYLTRGLSVIPIPHQQKAPVIDGWPALRLTESELPKYFNGSPQNIGVILGDQYGTADVDLDSAEAIAAAGELLPETRFVFGRPSKPYSHYFYRADPPVRSKRFLDPIDKACLVELRCEKSDGATGLQTVVPPSTHPSGERIRFEPGADGFPANVDAEALQRAVANVGAAALLSRHWPAAGSRNTAFLALAGILARAGWTCEQAISFHRAMYRALWGARADMAACEAEVAATFEKHGAGHQTTGVPSLASHVDKRAVTAALGWLGVRQQAEPPAKPKAPASTSFDLESLMEDTTITVPAMAIEGILPKSGLVLLGGRPKEGKSWLACQLALSFVTGLPLGGWLRVAHPGRCHLWALEDQFALTKDKMGKLLRGSRPDNIRDLRVFAELAQPILRGGDQIIRAALDEHPAELLILDSLFKLAGQRQPNSDISQGDYDVIDRVRKIALDYKCAAVIVMHTKKGARGGDPIENLLGTSGNTAAADAVCELKRKGREGKLTVVGRLVQRTDYGLTWFDTDEWGWAIQNEGDEDSDLGETSEEVLAYLEAEGNANPTKIAAAIHKSFKAVWNSLDRLREKGKVAREGKKWSLRK